MKVIVIIASLVACCCAAPSLDLQHPSPINPSVLVDIKPQEKVVLITDPLEIAKFKREIKQPLYPTVSPEQHTHHIAKRDHKPGHETKSVNKPNSPTPPKRLPPSPPTTTKKPLQKPHHETPKRPSSTSKRSRRDVETHQNSQTGFQKPLILPATLAPEINSAGFQKPQTLPSNLRSRRDVETHQNSQTGFHKPQTLPATLAPEISSAGFQKPQTLPAIFSHDTSETLHPIKRDIPVPLVAKYQHPEVSPKDEDSKEDAKVKSDKDSKEDKKEANSDHIQQVKNISEPKPLHQTSNVNHDIAATHATTTDDKKKPTNSDDHLAADEQKISSEHHFIRPKPVPVAELFARAHDD